MNRKNKLLSIGEISKLTGAGIKALRYYERINILKPVYVDPDTGYRYYSFNQSYLVELIMFCNELDIPLKELSGFFDGQETMNFEDFLAHGKKVAGDKIKSLERGLKFINILEQNITSQDKYPLKQIYTREFPQKFFFVLPCEQRFESMNQYEVAKLFFEVPYSEDDVYEWLEYGFLCEVSPSGVQRYIFIEVPQGETKKDCKVIPAGQYYCRQSDGSQIEQAADIFKGTLAGRDSFTVIETEVFTDRFNINKPIHELRVVWV